MLPEKRRRDCDGLLGRGGVLGDGLGALRDRVLGQFSRENESDRSLDLARRDGGLLVVSGKLGGLGGDTLKDVCDGI